ncbi:hypothetical protein [Methyloraptor flagellatus]|uniref:MxaK protein n=1 Tax=Methyloraptor flagellatus TaxID=3162530 RepID=A0AAU7X6Q7_9HYPH
MTVSLPAGGEMPRDRRTLRRAVRLGAVVLAWVALAGCLGAGAWSAFDWWRTARERATVAALAAGRDIAVGPDRPAPVVYARLLFLLDRNRLDEAEPLIETLAHTADRRLAAEALLAAGNARMTRAIDLIEAGKIDEATPLVGLAKQRYMQGLRRVPEHWSLKVDLDIAMRLVRDFPPADVKGDDEPPPSESKLWTDLPGLPKGLP